jgi:class 3 adenylate cyclase/tetratricopeptide (TPR) repeat protein
MTGLRWDGEPHADPAQSAEPQPKGLAEPKTWPVTIVYADVVKSTRLSRQIAKDAYMRVIERFQQEGRQIIREHGGYVRTSGDAVIGIFGVPVKGDDALQAANVAVRLRGQVLPALNDELYQKWRVKIGVRIGVHTDEAPVRAPAGAPLEDPNTDDPVDVLGEVVNLAQRLQHEAEQGEILIGQATYQRVRAWVTVGHTLQLELDGVERHLPAWPLFTVHSQPRLRSPNVPMVGRNVELSMLNLIVERTRASKRLHLVIVHGEAGVGKTRLVEEFVRSLGDDVRVLRGQCQQHGTQQHGTQQHGESVIYGPVTQMLQQAADIPPGLSPDAIRSRLEPLAGDDPHRAAQLASLLWVKDSAAEPEGTLRALRETLQLLARQQPPLVLVFDDLQWARRTLLNLIGDLSGRLQNDAIMLVCVARSQFLDDQPPWGSRHNATDIEIPPLQTGEVEELAQHLLDPGQPDPEVLEYIQERLDHSPLSIQLLVAVLIEDKVIEQENGRWRVKKGRSLAEVGELPGTSDVVRARLDRLPADELAALEGAAVIGPAFVASELSKLVEDVDQATVDRLVHKNLLRPGLLYQDPAEDDPWGRLARPATDALYAGASAIPSAGEDEFHSFAHPLVREAAYQRLRAEQRGQLHQRCAEIFTERLPAQSAQTKLLVGNHLDNAYQAYLESGQPADVLGPLACRAGEELAANGHQGVLRGGWTPTVRSVLRRAIELLPLGHRLRFTAQLDLARTLLSEEDLGEARQIYREVISTAMEAGNVAAEVAARLWELDMVAFSDPERTLEEGPEIVERAIQMFRGTDDPSLAKARYVSAYLAFMASRMRVARAEAGRAQAEAGQVGDVRLEATIRRLQCVVVFWGPAPVQEVLGQAEEAIAWAQDHGVYSLAALAHNIIARGIAMQGRFDDARGHNLTARGLVTDPGELLTLGSGVISEGMVEWYAGELDTAERILWTGWDELVRRGGQKGQLSVVALLARVLLSQPRDRAGEAELLIDRCEQEAAAGQHDIQLKCRQLRAILLARRGNFDQAEPLAREAVHLAGGSEQPESQAEACNDLATVLHQAGRLDEAHASARQAVELYERKGNLVSAGRARRLMLERPAETAS